VLRDLSRGCHDVQLPVGEDLSLARVVFPSCPHVRYTRALLHVREVIPLIFSDCMPLFTKNSFLALSASSEFGDQALSITLNVPSAARYLSDDGSAAQSFSSTSPGPGYAAPTRLWGGSMTRRLPVAAPLFYLWGAAYGASLKIALSLPCTPFGISQFPSCPLAT